jgi:hypothetical protein
MFMEESLPYSGLDNDGNWVGLSVDRVKFLSQYLGFTIKYVGFSRPTNNETLSDVLRLQTQNFSVEQDVFIGTSFAITPERLSYFSFVDAYISNSGYLVMQTSHENTGFFTIGNIFRFLAPFRLGVWAMLFGGVLLSAIALWTIDVVKSVRRVKPKFTTTSTSPDVDRSTSNDVELSSMPKTFNRVTEKQSALTSSENMIEPDIDKSSLINLDPEKLTFLNSLYYSAASLTGAGQLEPNNWLSKVYVLAWSSFVLLMVSSYTANLAASLSTTNSAKTVTVTEAIDSSGMKCFYRSSPYIEFDPTMEALGYPLKVSTIPHTHTH